MAQPKTHTFVAPIHGNLTIRTDAEFTVRQDGQIIGPKTSTQRFFTIDLLQNQEVQIRSHGDVSTLFRAFSRRGESGGGEKLVEVVESRELDMFSRLRGQLLELASNVAQRNGYDSYEEDSDLDFDDDEDSAQAPFTPYEYQDMVEEMPKARPQAETKPPKAKAKAEPDSPQPTPGIQDVKDVLADVSDD